MRTSLWTRVLLTSAALSCGLGLTRSASANPPDNRVVLEGFYWDCRNTHYTPGGDGIGTWYTYLANLMPRLRDIGFDGVWTPPPCKSNRGTGGMGYDLLDHYDIGQKYQCGARHDHPSTATRFGTQDELLRMIAVAHANGLEVYPDIVLNHCDGGAQDPQARGDQHKAYRYPAFGGAGLGRWPKDWWNFHPNDDHGWLDDDWRHVLVGSDICYRGRCADRTVNDGGSDYMRANARQWLIWLKRQTDVDGFRFDAVKHFPAAVVEDVLYNTMDAGKPEPQQRHYFAVGEFIGDAKQLDDWSNQTNGRCGTFDFALRQALFDMIRGGGFFDMGSLPNAQQNSRAKTVPFVNNHDTWRGVYSDSGGNGKDDHTESLKNSDELVSGTIDPDDPRAPLAYAAAMAVDGNPQIYYEDLFDNRDAQSVRDKQNPQTQPIRAYVANLIWCHQKLNFKDGPYRVPFQSSPDLLVIERAGKAIIALNDNGVRAVAPPSPIVTSFGPNTLLHDYSGTVPQDVSTDGEGKLALPAVPAMRYCVWGPAGVTGGFAGPRVRRTTQQFRMDDDLGDSNAKSLEYGGRLEGAKLHTAGAIWSAAGKPIRISLQTDGESHTELRVLPPDPATGSKSATAQPLVKSGTSSPGAPLMHEFIAGDEGYYTITAKLSDPGTVRQAATITVEYEAPAISQKIK